MLKKEAMRIVGGSLTYNTKMPCPTFNLPPVITCPTARAADMQYHEEAVCHHCYARGGQFLFPAAQTSMYRHYTQLMGAIRGGRIAQTEWVVAMATLIHGVPYFRWHSSGDTINPTHAGMIVAVAELTPETEHWCPTKQPYSWYAQIGRGLPDNLIVRFTNQCIGDYQQRYKHSAAVAPPDQLPQPKKGMHICNAPQHEQHNCATCRACWDKKIPMIIYPQHGTVNRDIYQRSVK